MKWRYRLLPKSSHNHYEIIPWQLAKLVEGVGCSGVTKVAFVHPSRATDIESVKQVSNELRICWQTLCFNYCIVCKCAYSSVSCVKVCTLLRFYVCLFSVHLIHISEHWHVANARVFEYSRFFQLTLMMSHIRSHRCKGPMGMYFCTFCQLMSHFHRLIVCLFSSSLSEQETLLKWPVCLPERCWCHCLQKEWLMSALTNSEKGTYYWERGKMEEKFRERSKPVIEQRMLNHCHNFLEPDIELWVCFCTVLTFYKIYKTLDL